VEKAGNVQMTAIDEAAENEEGNELKSKQPSFV
jgi:hypothetical protein